MFREPAIGTAVSMGIILFLMLLNVVGVRESSRLNIAFISVDIATQLSLVILGIELILMVNPGVLVEHMFGPGNWPSTNNLVLGIALAALAFTGVETVSQMAQEARRPATQVPRAYVLMIITVLVLFAGISLVALTAMTPQLLGDPIIGWARDPVAGIAANLPSTTLQDIFAPLVAILAASILLTATNAGLMGISRLAFNLSSHHQLPATLGQVHPRFRTPHVAIVVFCGVALLVLTPGFFFTGFFADLGALYVFGSLLSFAIAHAAILSLRVRQPDLPRPFKLHGNIKVKNRDMPITAILGLIATSTIWVIILAIQPFSRWAGIVWMAAGLLVYYLYRRKHHLPLTHIAAEQGGLEQKFPKK